MLLMMLGHLSLYAIKDVVMMTIDDDDDDVVVVVLASMTLFNYLGREQLGQID
jgi:hypothetical protein